MRLILAEDSALLREGLTMVLKALGHEILAEVETAPDLILATQQAMAGEGIDLVITDVRMPPSHSSDGLQAALHLREEFPQLPILVLSQYITTAYARELFARSASGLGYLLKDSVGNIEEFSTALNQVAAGGSVIDPSVVQHLLGAGNQSAASPAPNQKLARLSPRELEILKLMAQGYSNSEIEAELFISQATVAKHVGNIFDKLDLPADEGNRRVRAVLAFLEG